MVNNTVLYTRNLLRGYDLKCSYHKERKRKEEKKGEKRREEKRKWWLCAVTDMFGCGDYFTMYMYIKTSSCTP